VTPDAARHRPVEQGTDAVGDKGIGARLLDYGTAMLGGEVGRTDDQTPSDAVELDERQRGAELIARIDDDRASDQLIDPAADTAAVQKIGEAHAGGGAAQPLLRSRLGVS
jgi:hypothetical protein